MSLVRTDIMRQAQFAKEIPGHRLVIRAGHSLVRRATDFFDLRHRRAAYPNICDCGNIEAPGNRSAAARRPEERKSTRKKDQFPHSRAFAALRKAAISASEISHSLPVNRHGARVVTAAWPAFERCGRRVATAFGRSAGCPRRCPVESCASVRPYSEPRNIRH